MRDLPSLERISWIFSPAPCYIEASPKLVRHLLHRPPLGLRQVHPEEGEQDDDNDGEDEEGEVADGRLGDGGERQADNLAKERLKFRLWGTFVIVPYLMLKK